MTQAGGEAPIVNVGEAKRFRWRLLAVVGVAFVVRVVYVMKYSRSAPLGFDGNHYYELARRIADQFRYDDALLNKSTVLFPPGYPAVLALGRVVGLGTRTKLLVYNAAIGSATVALIGVLARKYCSAGVALTAAAIAAVYPNLFLADGALMTESVAGLFVVSALLLARRWRVERSWRVATALGSILAWYSLTRTDGVLFSVLLVATLAIRARQHGVARDARRRRGGARALLVLIVPVLVIAAWQVRVQREMHAFVPIAINGWAVMAGANCDATYHGARIGAWEFPCVKVVEAAERGHVGEVVQNRYARDIGVKYVRAHVSDLPKVITARLALTFGALHPFDELATESEFEGRNETWSRFGFAMYVALVPCALLGAVVLKRRGPPDLDLLITPVIAVVVSTMIAYGNHRFRMPLEPVLVVGAAVGMHRAWERWRGESVRPASGGLA